MNSEELCAAKSDLEEFREIRNWWKFIAFFIAPSNLAISIFLLDHHGFIGHSGIDPTSIWLPSLVGLVANLCTAVITTYKGIVALKSLLSYSYEKFLAERLSGKSVDDIKRIL